MDLDQSGRGFQRVRTYLGPTLGWKDELVSPSTEINSGGIHLVLPGESLLLVDAAAPVQINLPDVVKWVRQTADQPATAFERSITIKDIGGNAANFNIVVAPFGQQAIDNIQQALVISQARANIKLIPLIDLTGWMVETAIGAGGGGGGGGDVFKAGNNTFTGTNDFQNTITVPTPVAADNSQNAATTAWVTAKNYLISTSLAPYAPLLSPIFTGDPQAPTPTLGDNDTSIATTAFVQAALAGFTGGAPTGAEYITSSANAALTAERVLTNTASITWDFSTPGQAKANSSAGGGNVSSSGTPTVNQLAQWVTSTTIQGIDIASLGFAPIASPTFTGDPKAPTPLTADNDTSIATTAYVKANLANFQPLDADLTAISALAGTNTIYYRSAPDIWSPVSFSGLSFSGGILTVTASGGNVSNSGTPTVGQYGKWVTATTIQGVAGATVLSDIGAQPLDADLTSLAAASATNVIYYRSAADTWSTVTIGANLTFSGGTLSATGGGAPIGAQYITSASDATLTAERVLTDTATITWDFSTAGQAKANTAAGGGNVSNSGVPTVGQYGKWVTATTIQGVPPATVLNDIGAQPLDATLTGLAALNGGAGDVPYFTGTDAFALQSSTSYGRAFLAQGTAAAAASYIQAQPLDGDLTAIAGLLGTNTIYYRSATDTWSPVTFSGLSFSGGVLTVTAGGGNVNNSGTPAVGQYAKWTSATVIQGVAPATVLADIGAQPLDADLTAIAALAGTNTIYYRSGANTWSPVVVSTGLAFAGGNLTATGAPVGAEYITSTADATLSAERVLTDTATVTWDRATAGQIKANAVSAGGVGISAPGGRLSLVSNQPVMITSQLAKTAIFYTPYNSDQIPLYDGTSIMTGTTFAELTASTTDTTKSPAAIGANKVNDWYVWDDAGTTRLSHGLDWTSDTARAANGVMAQIKGVWLNAFAITNGPAALRGTYVGTTRSNASSQLDWIFGGKSLGGTAGFFGVWNAYNRCRVYSQCGDTTASWTYTNVTFRSANAKNTMRHSFVCGLEEEPFIGRYTAEANNATGYFNNGVGYDVTNAASGIIASGGPGTLWMTGSFGTTALGFHFMQAVEAGQATGSSLWFGSGTGPAYQTGMEFEGFM